MKAFIALILMLGASPHVCAQDERSPVDARLPGHVDGILQSMENASVTPSGRELVVTPRDTHRPMRLVFTDADAVGIDYEAKQWWVLPISAKGAQIHANRSLWILPRDAASKDHSWHVVLHKGTLSAEESGSNLTVTADAESVTLMQAEARPHSDPFGHRFSLEMTGGAQLEDALAAFYWGTMLPSVVEKTMAAKFPYSEGFVLSTLNVNAYAGSYPAVDHEFQIKGRLAMGSEADLDIVRRMIELDFKLMNDDPEHLYRIPTSVQPDGRREYHVRRDSLDRTQNAAMFPMTGNIEIIEEAWRYYTATKNAAWLRANIANLEHSAGWVLAQTDQYGRVWSDVYYEDQVIKDGRVTQAQAFAAHAFALLAQMETVLKRPSESARYDAAAKKMAGVLVAALPMGYWDPEKQRFIDWVDRNGKAHDHLHLLANELPVTFGFATAEQAAAVRRMIEANSAEFERFPSFVAADIAAYDKSEIGIAGPYDLCAAGRYWYWDAAYREQQTQNAVLVAQLRAVAAEAAKNGYFMGERYDMDHVYYVDGKDAHGAEKYYEYPNVFAAVLVNRLLGLSVPEDADVSVAPHLTGYGRVAWMIPAYALRYDYEKDGFMLENVSDKARRFKVDLSALGYAVAHFALSDKSGSRIVGLRSTVTLSPHEVARWTPEK